MSDNRTLRARLRADTSAEHKMLDDRIAQGDLRTSSGLAGFLQMQTAALSRLAPHVTGAATVLVIEDLNERARADLGKLGAPVPTERTWPGGDLHPLAVDYVIAGSRLGTVVLKRAWASSGESAVRSAGAYFGAPDYIDHWRAFCASAGRLRADGPLADRIVRDAKSVFQLYRDCARHIAVTKEIAHV